MRRWTLLTTLITLITFCAVPAAADAANLHLTPIFGYRTSSATLSTGIFCAAAFGTPCPDRAESEDAPSLGLILDVDLNDNWQFEILLNRQESELTVDDLICPECGTVVIGLDDLKITTLHLGAKRHWQTGSVEPFLAFGIGLSRISARSLGFFELDVDEEQPSASLAAGLDAPINDWLGLRLEARTYWIERPDEVFLDDGDLTETELAAGLTFSF